MGKSLAIFVAVMLVGLVAVTAGLAFGSPGPAGQVGLGVAWVGFVLVLLALAALTYAPHTGTVAERALFDTPPDHTAISDRTTRDGQSLTAQERTFVGETAVRFRCPACPDCGHAMGSGPSGGESTNWGCLGCGSEFNLMIYGATPAAVAGERISDAGPRELGGRHSRSQEPPTEPVA